MNDIKCDKIENYKTAFECFKERFLISGKSIFRLNSDDKILNENSIQYLVDNFVNNGYGGKEAFIDKTKIQMTGKDDYQPYFNDNVDINKKKQVQQNAIEVLAHCIWLWRLVPSNGIMNSTIKSVKEILDLNNELQNIKLDKNPFFNDKIKGIASTGTYYNTNKPFEIAFIIKFLNDYLNTKPKEFIDILTNTDNYNEITIKGDWDLKDGGIVKGKEGSSTKTASIFHALLYFFDPENYEAIVSNEHKKMILKSFEYLIPKGYENDFKPDIDCKIRYIKEELKKQLDKKKDNEIYFFYEDEIKEQWNPSILPAKNVIYYGAPGTGKTYNILELVKAKIKVQNKDNECVEDYYDIVQFHPSYSYEDFIDGIKPVKSKDTTLSINLELVDGVFKNLCKKAYIELKDAKETNREARKFYFIADEINRAELSRVFGELLLCIEEDKRLKFKNDVLEGVKVKTQNSSLWKEKNAVVILDNNKFNKENRLYFGVPENIYFLATMNDIDKSIDSFDLALRRRFKWVYKGCDYDVIYNYLLEKGVNEDDLSSYISDEKSCKGRCNLLNKYIRETLNLGASYELGHSYFMNIKIHGSKIPNIAYENLFDLELAPLLHEYLRSEISDSKELKNKLSCMKKIFLGQECK